LNRANGHEPGRIAKRQNLVVSIHQATWNGRIEKPFWDIVPFCREISWIAAGDRCLLSRNAGTPNTVPLDLSGRWVVSFFPLAKKPKIGGHIP